MRAFYLHINCSLIASTQIQFQKYTLNNFTKDQCPMINSLSIIYLFKVLLNEFQVLRPRLAAVVSYLLLHTNNITPISQATYLHNIDFVIGIKNKTDNRLVTVI